MKINEIIRQKRIAKGLTQEQTASYLGVSAPAVNKWENAVSYPDITLLPSLARLLDTDLNTLLSFQDDLSMPEINHLIQELSNRFTADGLDAAFSLAMDNIHEFPSCNALLLNVALALEGFVSMFSPTCDRNFQYLDTIWQLYTRVANGKDTQAAILAKSMLASKHISNKEFTEAEQLLSELPDETLISKQQLQITLSLAKEDFPQVALLSERKLVSDLNGVNSALLMLMDISLKEDRTEDARQIVDIIEKMTDLFDLWSFNTHSAKLQLFLVQKDVPNTLCTLKKVISALREGWVPSASLLYRHIPGKWGEGNMMELLLNNIVNELKNPDNHEYDFLRSNVDFQELLTDQENN